MINTAIVLAGGFGTRLQSVVKDIPKPMAPVAGKPFLQYLLQYLSRQRIEKVILAVGYKWEIIRDYFGDSFDGMELKYSIEKGPLGTGGGILKAINTSDENEYIVLNGDSFFNINLAEFVSKHKSRKAVLSIALKPMENFDRYGVVRTNKSNRIISFEEKKYYENGNINGGVYIVELKLFSGLYWPYQFSFEKDILEKLVTESYDFFGWFPKYSFSGFPFNDYFIDIGIPEDYLRSQKELPIVLSENFRIQFDKSWTLFLDRDGVINKKIENDYVRTHKQFEWLEGIQESLVALSKIFGRIIIVSNQQGVGKGYMKNEDVEEIHSSIMNTISQQGGRIDHIYFAPQLKDENSPMRKPEIGMAIQAKKDFPEIDFTKSIMVGDSLSDMEFGKKAGMKTVFISHGKPAKNDELIDFISRDLKDFSMQIAD